MAGKRKSSSKAFKELSRITPGGVNSPFRSFHEVGGKAILLVRGQGARVWDLEGRAYLDYLGAWGPAILGHAHPVVTKAAHQALEDSPVLGLSTPWELEMATRVQKAFPSMEMIRFVNSGAEAVESAVRLARGATRRPRIVRFEGGYHGHGDSVLWGYGPEENRTPEVCGVPRALARLTATVPFNDRRALERFLKKHGREVAALLVEPVAGSMGVIPPEPGFLDFCRAITKRYGVILIFDEVLTGFRIAWGGAQERYGVRADLTCLGKILGGGLPAGAYGGKRELMSFLSPEGPVYQAGTFSGNPVTLRAGLAVLNLLDRPGTYRELEEKTTCLLNGMQAIANRATIPVLTPQVGSMFAILFCRGPIRNYRESLRINPELYRRFFQGMLDHGILFPPSATDAAVLSLAHTNRDIAFTLKAFEEVAHKGFI